MMVLKDYQHMAMERFEEWYRVLEEKTRNAERVRADLIDSLGREKADEVLAQMTPPNHVAQAWKEVSDAAHVDRLNSVGEYIPNVCFKVPTGGGKTLLAGCALERMKKQTGLVLWIVPSTAIFEQTLRALKDKTSLLRQSLDRASANRVVIMHKERPLSRADIDQSLCIMLLMKQGADNRRNDFLKIRRDSSIYSQFFPPEDDDRTGRLLQAKNGLDTVQGTDVPKHSLLNVFKIQRPVVILDEAHKTRGVDSAEIASYVNSMNPSLILELSATPPGGTNVLVNVSGSELRQEEMIKMPINLTVMSPDSSWMELMRAAIDEFEKINAAADEHGGMYIRPIMVVRVERVGKAQRGAGFIHAEDVREYIKGAKSKDHGIAIKTAEQDDLKGVDLLSDDSDVRYIITKDALREGWDCPFAYMLVILDNLKSATGVTQLLGRILRQPGQKATGNRVLDSCYVYCRSKETSKVISYAKKALKSDGLSDIAGGAVTARNAPRKPGEVHSVSMKARFRPVYLPRVLHKDSNGGWIELDYDRHILSKVDWDLISAPDMSGIAPEMAFRQDVAVDIDDAAVGDVEQNTYIDTTIRITELTQILSETVPNSWQAARVVMDCIGQLRRLGHDDAAIHGMKRFVINRLNDHICSEVVAQAECIFEGKLASGDMRFDLEVDSANYRMREKYEVSGDRLTILKNRQGKQVQQSLFDSVYEEEFDTDIERSFAAHLDEADALKWWHRVAAKDKGEYYLRGWKRRRIWPDFVAMFGDSESGQTLRIYEIKGDYLDNPDTKYKGKVLAALQGAFNEWGTLRVNRGPMRGEFKILFESRVDEEEARLLNVRKNGSAGSGAQATERRD